MSILMSILFFIGDKYCGSYSGSCYSPTATTTRLSFIPLSKIRLELSNLIITISFIPLVVLLCCVLRLQLQKPRLRSKNNQRVLHSKPRQRLVQPVHVLHDGNATSAPPSYEAVITHLVSQYPSAPPASIVAIDEQTNSRIYLR
jgi:hypothetical protein